VAGLTVTLQAFEGETEVHRWETTVQPDGTVAFEGLDGTTGLVYLLSAEYLAIRYFSSPFFIAPDPPAEPPVLTVYEKTSDPSVIKIVADNSVILGPDGTSGTLRAMQVTTFENTSDRAYIGTGNGDTQLTVEVPLPTMAFDLEALHNPGSLVLSPNQDRRVYSILPVLPGIEEMIVTYRLLYTGDSYAWSKPYPYPVERVRLLTPQRMSVLLSDQWTTLTPTDVNGTVYDHYQADGGPAGAIYAAQLRGLPLSAGARSEGLGNRLRYAALGMGALAVAGVGGYAAFWAARRRQVQRAEEAATSDDGEGGAQAAQEEALRRLALLEEEYEAGRLPEEDYQAQREEHRRALRRLMEGGKA
jgi:hypothetical protein